jgi:hypothetical protein
MSHTHEDDDDNNTTTTTTNNNNKEPKAIYVKLASVVSETNEISNI